MTDMEPALPPRGSRKAWLQATRETCGISEDEFAAVAGCTVGEVILWEMPEGPEPPRGGVPVARRCLGRPQRAG